MRNNLDLNPHVIFSKPRNTNAGPKRRMTRHQNLEIPNHGSNSLIIEWKVIRSHLKHMQPNFAAGGFERKINVFKALVDLSIYFD